MICDEFAKDFGEIQDDVGGVASYQLKGLADQVASTSGDCCVPKKT